MGRAFFRPARTDQSELTVFLSERGLKETGAKWKVQTVGEHQCCRDGHYEINNVRSNMKSCQHFQGATQNEKHEPENEHNMGQFTLVLFPLKSD